MSMKYLTLTSFLIAVNVLCSQNDYGFHSVFDAYKSKTQIKDVSIGLVLDEYVDLGARFDYVFVGTFDSKITCKGDISFFPSLITLGYNKRNNIPYNSSYFDINFGRVFNHKRPIRIGEVETRIGMGLNVGLKFFDNNYADSYGSNAFFAYGFSFNTIIDFGENVQLFYLNTLNFSYNPRYEEMYRTMHEFYFMYNANWKIKPSIAPYVETFRYVEAGGVANDEITKRFLGLKFGVTAVIK